MALIDNCVHAYLFAESTGNFTDSVGSLDLSRIGTVSRVAGKIVYGAEFSGSSSNYLISSSNLGITGTSNRSFSWWSELDTTTNGQTYVSYGAASTGAEYSLIYESYNVPVVWGYTPQFYGVGVRTEVVPSTNYEFNVVTYDGTNLRWYVDGTLINTQAVTINTSDSPLRVGYSIRPNFPLDGVLSDLNIWTKVLTQTEVTELYNSGNGLAYPFTTDVTVELSTITMSMTDSEPTIIVTTGLDTIEMAMTAIGPTTDEGVTPAIYREMSKNFPIPYYIRTGRKA